MKERMFLLWISLLFLVPGCTHFIEWGKKTLYQGKSVLPDLSKAQSQVRSVTLYDQFTLKAYFDILWLSKPIRDFFIETLVGSFGINEQQKESFTVRNNNELKHYIVFYLVTPYDISFGESGSLWTLLLLINGTTYHPIEIKLIDLHPIYQAIFAKRAIRFCNTYQIKFDAQMIDGSPIIDENTKEITVLFRSLDKELQVEWSV